MRPLVTVGLPVYNAEAFVVEAVESVLAQDVPDLELIVSDNGSQDETAALVATLASRDPRIRLEVHTCNRGILWNFNRVLLPATGRTFAWLSADDRLAPGHLKACLELLETDPTAVVASSQVRHIDASGHRLAESGAESVTGAVEARVRSILGGNLWWIVGLGSVISTDLLRRVGGWPWHVEGDPTLAVRLALVGSWLVHPDHSYELRSHDSRMSEQPEATNLDWVRRHDPGFEHRVALPHWHQQTEMLGSILRSDLAPVERIRVAAGAVEAWSVRRRRHQLAADLTDLRRQVAETYRKSARRP